MSQAAAGGAGEFAALLRELKDRSGLSYGALSKRLHMSTSTLHRYCSGAAVPTDYAPVERFARACRATPPELVELHRRWVLADAARGSRDGEQDAPGTPPAPSGQGAPAVYPAQDLPGALGRRAGPVHAATPDGGNTPATSNAAAPSRRRRTALIASAAAIVVLGAVALAVHPPWGGGAAAPRAAGAPAGGGSGGSRDTTTVAPAAPFTVHSRPYVYDNPCYQHFLVNRGPAQIGPPASEQDAPRWAAANGAVASDEQRVALTVQGAGARTVVLEALHARVLSRSAPLAWNDYSMGVGCGGGVESASFDVDLDAGSPTVTVRGGQRDFPYEVKESDPEVLYVTVHTKAHDVRWDLTLDWSSGGRHGTVRIDNGGSPFRTSADVHRPGYDYPLGGTDWIAREE